METIAIIRVARSGMGFQGGGKYCTFFFSLGQINWDTSTLEVGQYQKLGCGRCFWHCVYRGIAVIYLIATKV